MISVLVNRGRTKIFGMGVQLETWDQSSSCTLVEIIQMLAPPTTAGTVELGTYLHLVEEVAPITQTYSILGAVGYRQAVGDPKCFFLPFRTHRLEPWHVLLNQWR